MADRRSPRPGQPMWILTQVAPYVDGPAGVHGVLPQAVTGLSQLAVLHGLTPVVVDDVADLDPAAVERGGVLALFTIGETPYSDRQKEAVSVAWRDGRLGVLGVHSATDACHTWDDYGAILGARFAGHPWTQRFTVEVAEPAHPVTAGVDGRWGSAWHDEVYLFADLRPDATVLLRLGDPEGQLDMTVGGARVPDCGFPLSWCHTAGGTEGAGGGGGRTFYSALGHFPGAWEAPPYLRYLSGGLAWLLGG